MEITIFDQTVVLDESLITELPSEIPRQINEYEAGHRRSFNLTVTTPDSFTGRVMEELLLIPYGQTRTYGDIAEELDTHPIAIGNACSKNPLPIIVPCHRVIKTDGGLGGYSAPGGVSLKRQLLNHELGVDRY